MIKNSELYIYDTYLNFKGVIDTYKSLRWRRKYFEAGEFELHLQANDKNIKMLQKDTVIIREESQEAAFVIGREINDDGKSTELIITGRFLSYFLYRRIIKSKITFSGKILEGMRFLLQKMTPFSILDIPETTIDSEQIKFQCTYKNVYNYIVKLSKTAGIGFRLKADIENKRYKFENFCGVNRTVEQKENSFYEFSEEYSNIKKANYVNDSSSLCNYVLVGGEGQGDKRYIVEIDNTEGLKDFEIVEQFVDAKSESKDEETSDEEYREMLRTKGQEYIDSVIETINFEAYVQDYKKKWDLGDIVTVKKESWNIKENLRITEVEEVIENNVVTVTPTFGTPLKETFSDDENE